MSKIDDILDAAQELFGMAGFEQTSVAEIAERAKVAAGTVIYYFKNKNNLLFVVTWRVLYRLYKDARNAVEAAHGGLFAIHAFADNFLDHMEQSPVQMRLLLKNTAFETLDLDTFPAADLALTRERYVHLLELALDMGMIDKSVKPLHPRSTAIMIHAMLIGLARQHLFHRESPPDYRQLIHEYLDTLLRPSLPSGKDNEKPAPQNDPPPRRADNNPGPPPS